MDLQVKITGVEELSEWFNRLPTEGVQLATSRALVKGTIPVVREITTLTPERSEGSRDEGTDHLIDRLRSRFYIDREGRGGVAQIDFGILGWLANLVERGHRMIGHRPGKRQLVGPKTPDGMVRALRFMATGLDNAQDEAIQGLCDGFAEGIEEFKALQR